MSKLPTPFFASHPFHSPLAPKGKQQQTEVDRKEHRHDAVVHDSQVVDQPPTFLDFLRYLCVVDTTRSKKVMGYKARRDIRAIVTEFAGTGADEATENLR